jgi:hypothetical protein
MITPVRSDGVVIVWMEYYGELFKWRVCWKKIDSGDETNVLEDNSDGNGRPAGTAQGEKFVFAGPFPTFSVSSGIVAYDCVDFQEGTSPIYEIRLYDTTQKSVVKTLIPPSSDFTYFEPAISNGKVVFVRGFRDKQSEALEAVLMLYDLHNDELTQLDLGSRCVTPSIFGETIAYTESAALPNEFGAICTYDLGSKAQRRVWPEDQYLSPSQRNNLRAFGGARPSINSRYVVWNSDSYAVIGYDLAESKLVRFPKPGIRAEANSPVFMRAAFSGNVAWYGNIIKDGVEVDYVSGWQFN